MAPDFYDNLPNHTSWVKVLVDFITCDEMGPHARIKRKTKYTREFALSDKKQEGYEKSLKNIQPNGNLSVHED